MGILNELTKKLLEKSKLTINREKVTTEDIIMNFPDGITIQEIDIREINKQVTGIYTFKECAGVFAYAGFMLTMIFEELVSKLGSIEEVNKKLKLENLKVKLEKGTTYDGKDITNVTLL